MTGTTPNIPGRIEQIRAAHVKGYASTGDEAWDRNPICSADGHAWPCEIAEVLELVGGEVSHRLSPIVGWLRLDVHKATGIDPLKASPEDYVAERVSVGTQMLRNATVRLDETIAFFFKDRP